MDRITITPDEYKSIKNIKSSYKETPYDIKKHLCWMDEDNDFINNDLLYNIIKLYTKCINIPQWFIKKYHIKKYHISTIMFFYITFGNDCIYLYSKKPLGNSDIYGDVAQFIMKEFNLYSGLDSWIINNKDNILNVIHESMFIFDKMIKELDLKSLEWIEQNGIWSSTENGRSQYRQFTREYKLKRILND